MSLKLEESKKLSLTFLIHIKRMTGSFWEVTLGKKVTQQTHIHSL